MSELKGRAIVITGASGNLGAATARLLLQQGARLVLVDRSADAVVHAMGGALPGDAMTLPLDLTDEEKTRIALGEAAAKVGAGRLDGLVCTVGAYVGGSPVADATWDTFERMFVVNVKTALSAARAALPHFSAEHGGAIVNVASVASLQGGAGEAAYSGAKAALLRLTESLAAETKTRGIRVNAVLPGTIDTPQNRAWMSDSMAKLAIDPAAIAEVILFLLSPRARAVNGAALRVTGAQ
jgi:NAD(P)-dependent dehydrogenase (short-subunit alcohol dehydrogenase family)